MDEKKVVKQEEGLCVVRKPFKTKDGKVYNEYSIPTTIRGLDKSIKLTGSTINRKGKNETEGNVYELLDIVFGKENKLPLNIEEKSMTGSDGKEIKFLSLTVKAVENNVEYSSPIFPFDKTASGLLKMKLAEMGQHAAIQDVPLPF